MKKRIVGCALIASLLSLLSHPSFNTNAHCLTPWHVAYPSSDADDTNSFGIGDFYHIKGRTAYYSWENSTTKGYFETALTEATNAWGGMIDNIENDTLACYTVSYNPNAAGGYAAYVVNSGPSYGHYEAGGASSQLVICNILNYSSESKRKVLTHELGHLWGIDDLYTYNSSLQSIYSNAYIFNAPTRHDKNAMFIGQDRPWYYDSDNNLKFLKQPNVFASNEWVYSVGFVPAATGMERFYVGSDGNYIYSAFYRYGETYEAYCLGSTLYSGQTMNKNQYLASPNGKFVAKMRADGNFAVYNTDVKLWDTATNGAGTGDKRIVVQPDGNIVIYDSTNLAVWNMWGETIGHPQAVRLEMQNDGNLVAYGNNNSIAWSINPHTIGTGSFNVVNTSDIDSKLSEINGVVNVGSTLTTGQTLSTNQYLSSPNKKFIAKMQNDGNFVIYNSDSSIWSSKTAGQGTGTSVIKVKNDGNICINQSLNSNVSYWELWQQAGAWNDVATSFVLQNDGNLVAYASNGTPIWWSGTQSEYGNSAFNIP